MNEDKAAFWDRKFETGLLSLEKPDPFFLAAFNSFVSERCPNGGKALDLAGGVGRHALVLAQKTWSVTVVDISTVAIEILGIKAHQMRVSLDLVAMDAEQYSFPPNQFDLVVMFYHFDRNTSTRVLSSLKPGGFLICKSSMMWDRYKGTTPPHLQPLKSGEILSLLPGLDVLHHVERPVKDRGVVEYVGQKR